MIVALLNSSTPVEITDTLASRAEVISLGRENVGQHWVGGIGYTGSKMGCFPAEALAEVAVVDPEQCEELQNWIDAMRDVDRLSEDQNPAIAAALEIEDEAREAFIEFVHTHSLAKKSPDLEITPTLPQLHPTEPPASLYLEVGYADLQTAGMAGQA